MEEELISVKNSAISFVIESQSLEDLEEIRLQFLGKNGQLSLLMKKIDKLPKEQKPEVGQLANEIKNAIKQALEDQRSKIKDQKSKVTKEKIDITAPGIKPSLGHLHLITQAIEEISSIFEHIGFKRVRYPEIEWDYYAFEALNFPKDHPARDDWETFFIAQKPDPEKGPAILTPHTSSGQIREMEKTAPPIRMLNIAKCYRRQSDISHGPMFHQFEGLVIDQDISITHLKGTLDYFVKSYFGGKRVSRIRPYHFQFTEPSFEVDITCGVCFGKGCRLCKGGWLELGGAGMVHPNVLKAGNIDSLKYSGFAFGWGVERVLMMKEGIEIDDLRMLYSSNLNFLEQF
ncbi:phenylalanine--tRNA ligase subunit alpha [Patescibacteria group bacterium]|nr:phenylalanine--tRNA ligase subunit alpha [Patescibacteria group bacterium]MCL5010373.1 phenylalanine--tRNA ligase subunit alpha [Patescibacteria group bacterium]